MSETGQDTNHDTYKRERTRFAKELDVSGLLCPIPVLRARRVLDDLKPGDLLLVTATDPASVQDMPAFCKMTGHKLKMAACERGIFMFEIEKRQAPPTETIVANPIRRSP